MIQAKTTFNGEEAYATVIVAAWEAIQRVVVYYHSALLQALNVSADPQYVKRVRDTSRTKTGGPKGSTRVIYVNPSREGESPHKRTGWLQRNVLYELNEPEQSARVGVTDNAKYGLFLEIGTRFMGIRPWLLKTLRAVLPVLRRLGASS